MNLTDEDVKEILRQLDNSNANELVLETDQFKLTLTRGKGSWTRETQTLTKPRIVADTNTPSATEDVTASDKTLPYTIKGDDGLSEIQAPIVGTFYRAPKPGAPPFVEIGSRVEETTVIAIIEVMKLMNSIPAGKAGEIAEICVEDAEFVDRGRTLMRIKPDHS